MKERCDIMSTLNDADLSGGKPANTDESATSVASNNTNANGAPIAGVDSSFALLQQVQTILLENNQAKARMTELESQVANFQKEREELVSKMEENEKVSNRTIESIQQQLSQREVEWTEKYENQEKKYESSNATSVVTTTANQPARFHRQWPTGQSPPMALPLPADRHHTGCHSG